MTRSRVRSLLTLLALLAALPASAQNPRPSSRTTEPAIRLHGFADAGLDTFAAAESFRAIFGSPSAPIVGGGATVISRRGLFGEVQVSRVRKTGERVIVLDGTVFPLGITNTVSIVPVEITGGFRWQRRGWRAVPYAGGGLTWLRYTETAPGAATGENTSSSFTGVHVGGGAEIPLTRWFAVGGEVRWTSIPGALTGPGSVGPAFGESDLGGLGVAARVVVGRR